MLRHLKAQGVQSRPRVTVNSDNDPSDHAPVGTLRSQRPAPSLQYQECGRHKVGTPRKHWGHQSTNCLAEGVCVWGGGWWVFTVTVPPDQKPLYTRPSPSVLTRGMLFSGCCFVFETGTHVAGDDTQLLTLQPPPAQSRGWHGPLLLVS